VARVAAIRDIDWQSIAGRQGQCSNEQMIPTYRRLEPRSDTDMIEITKEAGVDTRNDLHLERSNLGVYNNLRLTRN